MILADPVRLARRQIELDRERTARFPHLFTRKVSRMVTSPLAFLRGSAPLFYELLEHNPALSEGPASEGWIVGDAHAENFGAFRVGALKTSETLRSRASERVVFDLNDFDDALVGPWRFDVLRLMTSMLLAGRELGDGIETLTQCDAMLGGYVGAAFGTKRSPPQPHCVKSLIEQVRERTRKQLLDARTRVIGGRRRFILGPRYELLPPKLRKKAERAFGKWGARLAKTARIPTEALEVLDAAFRVAGVGSLGSLRVALLVRGKGGIDGGWIFDMKAEGIPAAVRLASRPEIDPGDRVCAAIRACLSRQPRMIGSTRLRGQSMFVRRLSPQEDKLDLGKVSAEQRVALARYLGSLLGAAHRRGAERKAKSPWTEKECARLLHRAVTLAGIHEATYLAYCHLVRG